MSKNNLKDSIPEDKALKSSKVDSWALEEQIIKEGGKDWQTPGFPFLYKKSMVEEELELANKKPLQVKTEEKSSETKKKHIPLIPRKGLLIIKNNKEDLFLTREGAEEEDVVRKTEKESKSPKTEVTNPNKKPSHQRSKSQSNIEQS